MTAPDSRAYLRSHLSDTVVPRDLRDQALELARKNLSGELRDHAVRFLSYRGRCVNEIERFIDRMTAAGDAA